MRAAAICLSTLLAATGCFTKYDGYAPHPTQCSPVGAEDPDTQEYLSCGGSETCVFGDSRGAFDASHTVCVVAPATSSQPGDACTYSNDCSHGLACGDTGCVTLCFVGSICGGGQACQENDIPLSVNGRSVGYCP